MGKQIVVVEDQVLFREFLIALLKNDMDHHVIAYAETGPDAIQIMEDSYPDLIILDILIPEISGLNVAKKILQSHPKTKILALSSECDEKTIHAIYRLGIQGFIDKKDGSVEIFRRGVHSLLQGRRFYSARFRETMTKLFSEQDSFPKVLTEREQEVLIYIGGGYTDQEIGDILELSPHSVQSHRRNLMRKLDVHRTPALIQFAHEKGFWKQAFPEMDLEGTYHLTE